MARTALALAVLAAACSAAPPPGEAPPARMLVAQLVDASGAELGTATLTQEREFVRLAVNARGLPPGQHGLHLHARGVCTPPDFSSAGPHYNPTGRQHGHRNPMGAHAGDFSNLEVFPDGRAQYDRLIGQLSLVGVGAVLPDSTALVIHAQPDDEMTDPTGNSGARIACGVFRAAAGRRTTPR
jgi:Cu-Zn family superoxide dismutase